MVDQVSIPGFQKAQTEQYFPLHTTSSEHLQRAPHEHSPKGCPKIILSSTPGHSWQLIGIFFTIGALKWYRKFLFVFQFRLIALVTWKRVNQPGSHWGTFPCASGYCPRCVNVKNGSKMDLRRWILVIILIIPCFRHLPLSFESQILAPLVI